MPVSPPRGEVKYISQGWSSEELSEDMGRKDGKSEGSSLQRWWLTVLSLGREENHIHKEEPKIFGGSYYIEYFTACFLEHENTSLRFPLGDF